MDLKYIAIVQIGFKAIKSIRIILRRRLLMLFDRKREFKSLENELKENDTN